VYKETIKGFCQMRKKPKRSYPYIGHYNTRSRIYKWSEPELEDLVCNNNESYTRSLAFTDPDLDEVKVEIIELYRDAIRKQVL
jgi:hypothetical protein